MDATTPALASIGIDIGKDVFHFVAVGGIKDTLRGK